MDRGQRVSLKVGGAEEGLILICTSTKSQHWGGPEVPKADVRKSLLCELTGKECEQTLWEEFWRNHPSMRRKRERKQEPSGENFANGQADDWHLGFVFQQTNWWRFGSYTWTWLCGDVILLTWNKLESPGKWNPPAAYSLIISEGIFLIND